MTFQFLERDKLPKMTEREIYNLNNFISTKIMESIISKLLKRKYSKVMRLKVYL